MNGKEIIKTNYTVVRNRGRRIRKLVYEMRFKFKFYIFTNSKKNGNMYIFVVGNFKIFKKFCSSFMLAAVDFKKIQQNFWEESKHWGIKGKWGGGG
jgi:hypothetical protein